MAMTPAAQTLSRAAPPDAPDANEPPQKPLLRGVSHQIAFFVALLASGLLVQWTTTREAAWAAAVFGGALVTLFGISALYHRVDWSPAARRRMRRADHAAIFVLIAGGYTPLFALVPTEASHGYAALLVIWAGALVGVVKSLVWPHAPKWLTALLCVGLGWAVVGPVVDRAAVIGALPIAMLVVSGTTYSLGAVVYALRRPDPIPRVFGYHEVFHLIVILASVCLFIHVVMVLRAAGGLSVS
jgi:hemolysin III